MQEKSKKIKILIILSIIILLMGILFLEVIYFKNIQKNNAYQSENKTYYEVTLKPNIYFFHNKIEANNYYIANSIKTVDIYFNYYLKNKTKENINYSYDITATLKSYADNGTKLIWTKDFNLKNITDLNQEEISIKENYNLDYQYYVNYVKTFQEYFNIKTETYLYVKLNIKINNQENPSVLLTIPINENIIDITMKEDNILLENNTQNITLNKIIVFDFIVIVTILIVCKILLSKNNEEAILKEYHDIIIAIQNKPNINSDNIIYLTNLKDLINIAVNNNINIFNYQNNYYTIINNTYYIYILKRIYKDIKN